MSTFEDRHSAGSMRVTASVWPTLVLRPEDRPKWLPSPFAYAAHLSGKAPLPEPDVVVRRGKLLEPVAYQLLAEDHGLEVPEDQRQVWLEHAELRAGATVDGLADGCGIEIKTVDDRDYRDKWQPYPPLYPRMQAQCAMACDPSIEAFRIVALRLGYKTVAAEVFVEPRRPAVIQKLEDAAGQFLEMLARDELPDPDPSPSTVAALAKVIALDPDAEIDLSEDMEALVRAERWRQARADRIAAEKVEDAQEMWFRARMRAASVARVGPLMVTAKDVARKAYNVAPSTSRQYSLKEATQ